MSAHLREALLVLADGTTFEGEAIGADPPGGIATGEVVFNTVLSGYQEVITDPSYAGQVITFTYPHIGNYGVAEADDESRRPFCRGVIVRDLARRPSSWRAADDLGSWLTSHGVPGISGVDTRRLTRHIREAGSMPCAFGTAEERTLKEAAFDEAPPGMLGLETALAVVLTELDLPLETVMALFSWRPAAIARIEGEHGGPVAEGRPANLSVIDPDALWVVEPERLASRSRNTPFAGRKLRGRVRHTVLNGEPVVIDAEAQR